MLDMLTTTQIVSKFTANWSIARILRIFCRTSCRCSNLLFTMSAYSLGSMFGEFLSFSNGLLEVSGVIFADVGRDVPLFSTWSGTVIIFFHGDFRIFVLHCCRDQAECEKICCLGCKYGATVVSCTFENNICYSVDRNCRTYLERIWLRLELGSQ